MIFDTRLRAFFLAIGIAATVLMAPVGMARADDSDILSRDRVLRDADIAPLGNPDGDITIVEYFDYQCGYCRQVAPILAKVVKDDGKVRLVLKDWPVFGDLSKYAARITLACKYQGKYEVAHNALIGATEKITDANIAGLLTKAGIDFKKATLDLATNKDAIDALMSRNDAQAKAFGFQGTPSFIVGTFRIPGGIDAEQFKQAIADARVAAKKSK